MQDQITSTNILSLMETTKEQRTSFVNDVITRIENGEVDALKIHCQVKSMESILELFTDKKTATGKAYSGLVLEEASKQGGKSFDFYNAKFQIKEAGTVYDWTVCEDMELNDLLIKLDVIKSDIKSKQEFLKNVKPEGMLITDEATGDTYKVYPPSKSSTTVVSVSIK